MDAGGSFVGATGQGSAGALARDHNGVPLLSTWRKISPCSEAEEDYKLSM